MSALVGCYVLMVLAGGFYYPKWKQSGTEATISWDVSGYYIYLPALFIYKDVKQCFFKDRILKEYHPTPDFQQGFLHASGNYVFKYASGQAILYAPFFFTAHLFALHSDHNLADGFSYPYQVSIGLGMLLYAFLGLWILHKVLLLFFRDGIVALTLIAIVFASNYLDYAAINGAMTHNTLFTLYATLIWCTHKFYQKPTLVGAALLGLLIGLATLIRPTEIISFLIPLLWGISNKDAWKNRLRFFFSHPIYWLTICLLCSLLIGVQLIYWKLVSDEWLVYSYQDAGFDWLHPHIKEGMVSYRSGWLTYSPAMLLALGGFIPLYRKRRDLFWVTAVFSFLFLYICFSWSEWWYGGSLGQRAMVQAYPILAFPMAAALNSLLPKNQWTKLFTLLFLLSCTLYNLWLTHQAHKGGLFKAGQMTKAYFWAVLGRFTTDERVPLLLDNKYLYYPTPKKSTLLYTNNFDDDTSAPVSTQLAIAGKSIVLNKEIQYSAEYPIPLPAKEPTWLRVSADFKAPQKEWDTWKITQFTMKFYSSRREVQSNFIRVHRILNDGELKNIPLDVQIPKKPFDQIKVSFWNAGSDKSIIIDNLKAITF